MNLDYYYNGYECKASYMKDDVYNKYMVVDFWLKNGVSYKEVAEKLGMSVTQVKEGIEAAAYEKLEDFLDYE